MEQQVDNATQDAQWGSNASPSQQETSIFKFRRHAQAPQLSAKSSGRRSRQTTPRNLIVPDLTDIANAELPTAPMDEGPKLIGSARKYLPTEAATEQTGEPKHKHKHKTRVQPPQSLRGKLNFYLNEGKAVSSILRSARRSIGHMTLQQTFAFVLMLAGMLSESGTPAPRYNVPLAVALILLPVATENDAVEYLQHRHHRLYISGLALATAVDFIWLMRPEEGSFNGYFLESAKSFTDIWITLCAFAKIGLIFSSYFDLVDTEPPIDDDDLSQCKPLSIQPPNFRLWDKMKHFFPRRTLPKRAQLSLEVLHRVLVLAWIHVVCGVLFLVLGLVATIWYSGRTQFREHPVGVPLHIMLLIKAATTLLTFLTVSHRINYNACLELYGLPLHALHHRGIPGTDPLFPPQLRWEDSDDDVDSSDDDGSSNSDEDSDDSDAESNSSDTSDYSSSSGDADMTPAERRNKRLAHRQRRLERDRLHSNPHEAHLPIVDAEDVQQGGEKYRRASTIATARDVVESANSSGTGAWVRHWHEESGRAYLVHSLTGEAVWEIVSGSKRTPRTIAWETQSSSTPTLSLRDFEEHWDELVDGGGFNCRVSRIPDSHVLAQHLKSHDFRVASDNLRRNDADQQRTVLFYAEGRDYSNAHDDEPIFMGEFVFDSLSLKLCARFRCGEPEQIVSFVKRLQLKEIVGAYTPCE
ncbi:hypothetical protein PHYBOEH_003111 [Phytophthora boehmeriae]|uniref:Beta-adaptin appendage C-terminal subdomain domain-containing protein n=1 Tax=Phytophthora boehmeriae TaxID=109152 RepID=A0A8T1WQY0_9STRA|nr:hypothetical protein PHYBOEH_003111 [Phytophthora boehmeriae]